MSGLLNPEIFGSDGDESEDEDFVPEGEGHDASEEENSGEDEALIHGEKPKKKIKKKKNGNSSASSGVRLIADENQDEKESRKKEFEAEAEEKAQVKEKEKTDALWADFMGGVKKEQEKKKKTSVANKSNGLGSFGTLAKNKKPIKNGKAKSKLKSSMDALFDLSKEAPKNKNDSFLPSSKSIVSSLFESSSSSSVAKKPKLEVEEETSKNDDSKVKITQVFDFAGENIKVTKEVDKDSKEAKKFLKTQENNDNQEPEKKGPGGIGSIMGIISGKKPKMGCLDKTQIDWNDYVKEEGIREELSTFNKGKDGYVEKQLFLERADLRRFEAEKAAREKTRKPLNR